MPTSHYEAACGVTEGDIVEPGNQTKLPFRCTAILLVPATGVKYTHEMGMDDDGRTHVVEHIYQSPCEKMVGNGTCPVVQSETTIFLSPPPPPPSA